MSSNYSQQRLHEDLVAAGFTDGYFNSNNAWGFGGGIGRRFTRGDTVVKIFTAYQRHLKPVDVVTVTIAGRRVLDLERRGNACAEARDLAIPDTDGQSSD